MTANHHVDNINKLIITDWRGDADVNQFIGAYLKYQKNVRNNQMLGTYDEIVNFSKAKKLNFNLHDLVKYVGIAVSFDSETNTKLAIIVNTRAGYGLAKGYMALRKLNPKSRKDLNVFFTESEALKWINNNV